MKNECACGVAGLWRIFAHELLTRQGVGVAPIPQLPNEWQQQVAGSTWCPPTPPPANWHSSSDSPDQRSTHCFQSTSCDSLAVNPPALPQANPIGNSPDNQPANPPNCWLAPNCPVPTLLANILRRRHQVGKAARGVKDPEHALRKILMKDWIGCCCTGNLPH